MTETIEETAEEITTEMAVQANRMLIQDLKAFVEGRPTLAPRDEFPLMLDELLGMLDTLVEMVHNPRGDALPDKSPGEKYGAYYSRLSFQQKIRLVWIAENMGIRTESVFTTYL